MTSTTRPRPSLISATAARAIATDHTERLPRRWADRLAAWPGTQRPHLRRRAHLDELGHRHDRMSRRSIALGPVATKALSKCQPPSGGERGVAGQTFDEWSIRK